MLFDSTKPIRTRLVALGGFIVTLLLLFLGAIWPSVFTIIALFALPAPLLLAAVIVQPKVIAARPKLRVYLALCIGISILSCIYEAIWLARSGHWIPPSRSENVGKP
jgi:hypothetical protein